MKKCIVPHTAEKKGVTIKTFEAGRVYNDNEAELGTPANFEPVEEAAKSIKTTKKKTTREVTSDAD